MESKLKGLIDLHGTDAMQGGLFLIHDKIDLGLLFLHEPVRVHYPRGLFKNSEDLFCKFSLPFIVRTIDFSDKGR